MRAGPWFSLAVPVKQMAVVSSGSWLRYVLLLECGRHGIRNRGLPTASRTDQHRGGERQDRPAQRARAAKQLGEQQEGRQANQPTLPPGGQRLPGQGRRMRAVTPHRAGITASQAWYTGLAGHAIGLVRVWPVTLLARYGSGRSRSRPWRFPPFAVIAGHGVRNGLIRKAWSIRPGYRA